MLTMHVAPLVLPIVAEPVLDGAVVVDADRIVAVGTRTALAGPFSGARMRVWPGILMPGLVNAHTRLQYTDLGDLATAGLSFTDWARKLADRRSDLTYGEWIESTRRGVHLLLRSGTTAAADVAGDRSALIPPARAKLAGVSYVEAVGDERRWRESGRDRAVATLAGAPGGRWVGAAPSALHAVDTSAFGEYLVLARRQNRRVHTLLAESALEAEYVRVGRGPLADANLTAGLDMALIRDGGAGVTPTAHLDALGGLGPDVHVAHGVHCGPEDRALLRERGTAVALCVRANATLGTGEAPVAAYLAEGSPIAIGTGSLASAPSLDLLEEAAAVRATALRQGYDRPDLARRVIEAATLGGAAAMGLDSIGRLAPGARADLAVFDAPVDPDADDDPAWDPYATLLTHSPRRCLATILAGTVVHRGV